MTRESVRATVDHERSLPSLGLEPVWIAEIQNASGKLNGEMKLDELRDLISRANLSALEARRRGDQLGGVFSEYKKRWHQIKYTALAKIVVKGEEENMGVSVWAVDRKGVKWIIFRIPRDNKPLRAEAPLKDFIKALDREQFVSFASTVVPRK